MHVALPRSRGIEKTPAGEQRLGFLAAGRDEQLGYVGGYLLTTARARPLEFHYTTPIKPSATHRILYGADLEPYLFADLIAAGLVQQCSSDVAFIVTDQPMALNQRSKLSYPMVYVAASIAANPDGSPEPALETHPAHGEDAELVRRWLSEVETPLNLAEPFARVWQALREAIAADAQRPAA